MADDRETSADSQVARVAEYRLRALVRLSEWDLDDGPTRLMHAEWDWQTQIHYQDYMRDDLPDLLVSLGMVGDGTLLVGQHDDKGTVAHRSVPLPPGKRKAPPRAQIDAVRDALGWLVRREAQDTGCEGAR